MRAMISQPMGGVSEGEIRSTREKAVRYLNGLGYSVIDTLFDEETIAKHPGLYFLGKSIEAMADVDLVYFCKGWEYARGCRCERDAALRYGLEIMDES